jgi:hypothetical protein
MRFQAAEQAILVFRTGGCCPHLKARRGDAIASLGDNLKPGVPQSFRSFLSPRRRRLGSLRAKNAWAAGSEYLRQGLDGRRRQAFAAFAPWRFPRRRSSHDGVAPRTQEKEPVMTSRRVLTLVVLALAVFAPNPVKATAIANSTLNFSNLSIVPGSGSLSLDDVWLLQAFASANNSLGGNDAQFNSAFSPGTTSASAEVIWAKANGSATAAGAPPNLNVFGSATSSVNIPGCNPAAAFSSSFGNLSDSFSISGTGTVAVQIGIDIGGMLHAMTDACGLKAMTQTIFSLQVDGNQVVFDSRLFDVGLLSLEDAVFSVHLSTTLMLDAGVTHFLLVQADSESQAQTQVVEPPTSALLLAALGALLWLNRRSERVRL